MTSIKKPQSAFQYYLKAWKDMPKELKVHFIELAKDDKERYEEELLGKEQGDYVGAITVHYTSFDNSTWTSQN